jgi:hypothetical protein
MITVCGIQCMNDVGTSQQKSEFNDPKNKNKSVFNPIV